MKQYYSLLITLLFPLLCNAQGGDWKWVTGGFQNDLPYGNKIIVAKNGDVIIVGGFRNTFTSGSIILQSQGLKDVFIARYTNAGQLIWAKRIGGSSDDWAWGIAEDKGGNLYVTGYFTDTVSFDNVTLYSRDAVKSDPTSGTDIFLAKYDANGNFIWVKQAGGPLRDRALCMTIDDAGFLYLAGEFADYTSITPFSYAYFDTTRLNAAGQYGMFLAKYDTSGTLKWAKQCGGYYGGLILGLVLDKQHNIIAVGGYSAPYAYFDTIRLNPVNATSPGGMFIVKYDSSGKALWANGAGGNQLTDGYSVTTDAAGNSYVTGLIQNDFTYFGNGYVLPGDKSYGNAYMAKYSPSGNLLWAKNAGVNLGDNNYAEGGIILDKQSNIYITGTFSNISYFDSGNILSYGFRDIMVCKYDSSGSPISFTHAGGNYEDDGNDIAMDSSGNLYVTGLVGVGTSTFGSHQYASNATNMYNVFVAKLSPYANWINAVSKTSDIYLYPNPSNGSFTFYYGKAAFKELAIYNALGEIVTTKRIDPGKQSEQIVLPDLPNGTYFINTKGVHASVVKKLIIEH